MLSHLRLELCERPVGGPRGVGDGHPVGFVWGQPLHPSHHPLLVVGGGCLRDVGGAPRAVPPIKLGVFVSTDVRVSLKINIYR